jgi:hypothetical protein
MKRPLSRKLETLLLIGVKNAGTYEPEAALLSVAEHMTMPEFKRAHAFFTWLTANELQFGYGNIRARWQQWQDSLK